MGNMKNMVILKDINSNIVEEAIIVFKENVKMKNEQTINKTINNKPEKSLKSDLCVKEAENIILDYIKKRDTLLEEERLKSKIKYLKIMNIMLVISILVVSILAL